MTTGSTHRGGRHTGEPAAVATGRSRAIVWTAAGAAVVLLLAAGGYRWLSSSAESRGCTGAAVTTTVAASPDQFPVMSTLASRWNQRARGSQGRCAQVAVVQAESHAVAAALGPSWDTGRDGRRPDVWAPDSRDWMLLAAARPDAKPLLPSAAPSVATSAIVLALPRPMAEAMGWPRQPVHLADLLGAFGAGKTWAQFGHPTWGAIRFGMTDPTRSSAGLDMLLSIMDRDGDGKLSNAELTAGVAFSSAVTAVAPSPAAMVDQLNKGGGSAEQAMTSAVAFPTDEHGLLTQKPAGLELVPVYADRGVAFADHPYAILTAPWVDRTRAQTARLFRDYLLSADGQRTYGADGFRDPTGSAAHAPSLTRDRGFDPEVRAPSTQKDAASVSQIAAQWSLLQRPVNVLIALDISGSMNDVVPQLGITRLQLLQRAAVRGIGLLNNVSSMGLWQFSSRLTPTTDYQELVPFGPMTGRAGPTDRRQALLQAIGGLRAHGGTGLYDTADAAFHRMQELWRPDGLNFVMLITDGKNEDDIGLNLDELLQRLQRGQRPDRPTPILGIAVGPEADAGAMTQISKATGGRTFVARNDADAIQEIVLAFAGRLR